MLPRRPTLGIPLLFAFFNPRVLRTHGGSGYNLWGACDPGGLPPGKKTQTCAASPESVPIAAIRLPGMPGDVPQLPDAQYSLPEAVGRLFDCTVLSGDALRTPADIWCRLAMGNLLCAGAVVRPMRAAVNQRLGAANGAAAVVADVDDGVEQRVYTRLRLRTLSTAARVPRLPATFGIDMYNMEGGHSYMSIPHSATFEMRGVAICLQASHSVPRLPVRASILTCAVKVFALVKPAYSELPVNRMETVHDLFFTFSPARICHNCLMRLLLCFKDWSLEEEIKSLSPISRGVL